MNTWIERVLNKDSNLDYEATRQKGRRINAKSLR
jgi:hypothetical protein